MSFYDTLITSQPRQILTEEVPSCLPIMPASKSSKSTLFRLLLLVFDLSRSSGFFAVGTEHSVRPHLSVLLFTTLKH